MYLVIHFVLKEKFPEFSLLTYLLKSVSYKWPGWLELVQKGKYWKISNKEVCGSRRWINKEIRGGHKVGKPLYVNSHQDAFIMKETVTLNEMV